jgi:hypothetical protein
LISTARDPHQKSLASRRFFLRRCRFFFLRLGDRRLGRLCIVFPNDLDFLVRVDEENVADTVEAFEQLAPLTLQDRTLETEDREIGIDVFLVDDLPPARVRFVRDELDLVGRDRKPSGLDEAANLYSCSSSSSAGTIAKTLMTPPL